MTLMSYRFITMLPQASSHAPPCRTNVSNRPGVRFTQCINYCSFHVTVNSTTGDGNDSPKSLSINVTFAQYVPGVKFKMNDVSSKLAVAKINGPSAETEER